MRMSFGKPILKVVPFNDPIRGGKSYRLIDLESGERVPFYTEYLNARKHAGSNSVEAYAYDLHAFFNFLYTASQVIHELMDGIKSPLVQIVHAYPEFLLMGIESPSPLIKSASEILEWKPIKSASQKRYLSTVSDFIKVSSVFHKIQHELLDMGIIDTQQSPEAFSENLLSRASIDSHQRRELINRSMLAGVIQGGPQLINKSFFKFKKSDKNQSGRYDGKDFPLNKAIETINNATCARDQALWALLFGTGIRTSEALNLLMEDIDPIDEMIHVINPNNRILDMPIKPGNDAALPFKSRKTKETYFIEPFRSIFFTSLKQYIKAERPKTNHRVVFVSLKGKSKGNPLYWASNANTHNKPFKRAAKKAGVSGYTLHSLRHTYGFFCVNHIPTEYGAGLDLRVVQLMMGHGSITSTAEYAKQDKEKARAQLEAFNRLLQEKELLLDAANENSARADQILTSIEHFISRD